MHRGHHTFTLLTCKAASCITCIISMNFLPLIFACNLVFLRLSTFIPCISNYDGHRGPSCLLSPDKRQSTVCFCEHLKIITLPICFLGTLKHTRSTISGQDKKHHDGHIFLFPCADNNFCLHKGMSFVLQLACTRTESLLVF